MMTTLDENVNWMKLTHLFSSFPLKLRALFCTSTLTSDFLIDFLDVLTRENIIPLLMYTMYTNALKSTPYDTHISSYMV